MSRVDPELERVDNALRERIEDLATEILGQPNKRLSSRRELRWGNRGSVKLNLSGPNRGLYVNYEAGNAGGGPLDLILIELGLGNIAQAIDWAYDWLRWEKPRYNSMSVAERLEIESTVRALLGQNNGVTPKLMNSEEAAKAARPSVMVATPARGRFANAVASVAVGAVVESPAPAAVRAAEAAEEALDSAPLFIKGRFPREADVLRLSAMVMGGDVVFQFTGYADGEFSNMLTEATSIAVGAIAKEIVADVVARHGKAVA